MLALFLFAFPGSNDKQLETGKLTSLNNEIDTTTGTVKFRAEFANHDLTLFPNQFVNARLLVRTLNNATLVPSAAVQHNGTDSFVYVVKPDNTVAVQPITAITNNDTQTAVEGIGPGVSLATSGFDRLEGGVKVSVPQRNGSKKGQSAGGAGAGGTAAGGNQAP
jgi:multidrug efflux system membrane fusion protein